MTLVGIQAQVVNLTDSVAVLVGEDTAYVSLENLLNQLVNANTKSVGLSDADSIKLSNMPRHREIQQYIVVNEDTVWTDHMKSVSIDGSSISFIAGAGWFVEKGDPNWYKTLQPMVGISWRKDGIGKEHRMATELEFILMPRRYEKESIKADLTYLSFKTDVQLKYAVFENTAVTNRLNIVGSAGYIHGKDADETGYRYTGSGVTVGGGLEYRHLFGLREKKNGKANNMADDSWGIELMYEVLPIVRPGKTTRTGLLSATLSYSFGCGPRWIRKK
ncbi:MAG: hypothetical protein IKR60_00780 [Alphaproteobacteria bacterium]|nr:hypothetical protein [Alphaproteobacteria bacterium]